MKNKILLVADVPNWIFHRHCLEIRNRLSEFYDFDIIFRNQVKKLCYQDYDKYDLIYILDSRLSIPYNLKDKTIIGIRNEFSYLHDKESLKQFYLNSIQSRAKAFHVVNRNQLSEFQPITDIPLYFLPHGVDTDIFKPQKRIDINSDKLVIGINGSITSGGRKGFDIVERACKTYGCELVTVKQDFKNGHLSKEEMPAFYEKIHIYCNMSLSEGLNNSIMEAGAMQCLVIATPVGAATEMIINGETGFLCDRSVEDLLIKFKIIDEHRWIIQKCGIALSKLIKDKWSWDVCIQGFRKFFDENLNK